MVKEIIHLILKITAFSLLIVICFGCKQKKSQANTASQIDSVLNELYQSYEGTYEWLYTLYSQEQKGFHFAKSSLTDPEKYFCAIIPNVQILRALDSLGVYQQFDPELQQSFVDFFVSKQDSSGYFRNLDPEFDKKAYEFQRAQLFTPPMLEDMGYHLERPIPASSNEAFPELESLETWKSYLNSLDWSFTKNYTAGSHSSTTVRSGVNNLEEPLRSQLINYYFSFLDSIQSEETGLWGTIPDLRSHKAVSGAMKVTQAYRFYDRDIPNADLLLESVIWTIKNDHDVHVNYCYVRNPVTTILNIQSQRNQDLTDEQLHDILTGTVAHHKIFMAEQGGFLRSTKSPFLGDGATPLSDPQLIESNLNAVGQAIYATYIPLHNLAGRKAPDLPGTDDFIKKMNALN